VNPRLARMAAEHPISCVSAMVQARLSSSETVAFGCPMRFDHPGVLGFCAWAPGRACDGCDCCDCCGCTAPGGAVPDGRFYARSSFRAREPVANLHTSPSLDARIESETEILFVFQANNLI